LDLGSNGEIRAGSTPVVPTNFQRELPAELRHFHPPNILLTLQS
jgi:hypothetical protein